MGTLALALAASVVMGSPVLLAVAVAAVGRRAVERRVAAGVPRAAGGAGRRRHAHRRSSAAPARRGGRRRDPDRGQPSRAPATARTAPAMVAVSVGEVRAALLRAADGLDRAAGEMTEAVKRVQDARLDLARAGDGTSRAEPPRISALLLGAAVVVRDAAGQTRAAARSVRQVGTRL
ncbi:hypothetical protein [Micromonospora sp. CPCC 205561]|uniref:hypothetical protein n=1 Tax=Micromonospora sp. CPCC 205561 TaxID=3122407 RepID=UPI002FEEE7AB